MESRPSVSNPIHLWHFFYLLIALLITAHPSHKAFAQSFPTRPLRLILPTEPGGPTDQIARTFIGKLGQSLGQPIVAEYKIGANSIIAAQALATSQPDGYTYMLATIPTLAMNPVTYKSLPYNVARDFSMIALVCAYDLAFIARTGLDANSIADLIALAKAKPGQLTYGSTGNGSHAHFGGVMLEQRTGVKMVHVPFKGQAQVLPELLANRLDFTITSLSATILSNVNAGKLKVIASSGQARFPKHPNIPTVAEVLPGYVNGTSYSLVTRAGTPRPIILRINNEINRTLQSPDVKEPLEAQGYDVPANSTPESLARYIAEETERWGKVAREANIRFE